jgi:hypothetical protein
MMIPQALLWSTVVSAQCVAPLSDCIAECDARNDSVGQCCLNECSIRQSKGRFSHYIAIDIARQIVNGARQQSAETNPQLNTFVGHLEQMMERFEEANAQLEPYHKNKNKK